jgi:hypothetical protein
MDAASVDPVTIWEQVTARIPARGFVRTLVDAVTPVAAEGRMFVLAYPASERSSIETVATASNRRQLETLLNEISGREWTLRLEAREGLPAKKTSAASDSSGQQFKDDPLIQEALNIFKGTLKS